MLQLDPETINGIGGLGGGIGGTLTVLYILKKLGIMPGTNGKKEEHIKRCAEQVDEIHDWYGPKGPMDRMTTQMEAVNENTKATTGVLEKILIVLEKRN